MVRLARQCSGLLVVCAAAIAAGHLLSCASGGADPPPPSGHQDASTDDPIDAAEQEEEVDAARSDARRADARVDAGDEPDEPDARPGSPDASPGNPDARLPDAGPIGGGLGPWTGRDRVDPSQSPPFNVPVNRAPLFVTLGWDDNGYSGVDGSGGTGGMNWAVSIANGRTNPDGSPIKFSFYFTSTYIGTWGAESPTYVKRSWRAAKDAGHELGNHTHTHGTGYSSTLDAWRTEVDTCIDWLTKPFDPNEVTHTPDATKGIGATAGEVYGFRTPRLEYNSATLANVNAHNNFWYDTSIEEGYQPNHDGTNFLWPYTLDTGSPGHEVQLGWEGTMKTPIAPQPGLWEIPVHVFIVPPDDRCAEYGVPSGLRTRLKQRVSWFDIVGGKITGFDYNLWYSFNMTKAEFLATVKYTFDQRRRGNRAPYHLGMHSDIYASRWPYQVTSSLADRQSAVTEFIDYVRSKPEVRVVSAKQALDWIRNPVPLP